MSLSKRIGGHVFTAIGDVQLTPACLQYEAGVEQLSHGVSALLESVPVVELIENGQVGRGGHLIRVILKFGEEQYDANFSELLQADVRIQPNLPVTLRKIGDSLYAVLQLGPQSIEAKFELYRDEVVH